MGLNPNDWCPYKKSKLDTDILRGKGKGSHSQAKQKGSRRNQFCRHFDVRYLDKCSLSPSACGICYGIPGWLIQSDTHLPCCYYLQLSLKILVFGLVLFSPIQPFVIILGDFYNYVHDLSNSWPLSSLFLTLVQSLTPWSYHRSKLLSCELLYPYRG